MECGTERPGLAGVMEVTVEVVSSTGFSAHLHRGNTPVRLVMEGLFAHFFSPDRPTYDSADVRWFLQLANEQGHWCCLPFQEEEEEGVEPSLRVVEESVGVVAGGLEEDLLSKLEKSAAVLTPSKVNLQQTEVRRGGGAEGGCG